MTTISITAKVLMYVALFVSCSVQLYQTHVIKKQSRIIKERNQVIEMQNRTIVMKDRTIVMKNQTIETQSQTIEKLTSQNLNEQIAVLEEELFVLKKHHQMEVKEYENKIQTMEMMIENNYSFNGSERLYKKLGKAIVENGKLLKELHGYGEKERRAALDVKNTDKSDQEEH